MVCRVPPYFLRYAATKAGLPADFESGNQSPLEKMPLTLAGPTLLGNSTGELAPFERNRYLGLNLSWIMALTCEYASADWVPATTMSGLAAATLATMGVRSAVSGG